MDPGLVTIERAREEAQRLEEQATALRAELAAAEPNLEALQETMHRLGNTFVGFRWMVLELAERARRP